MWLFPKNTVFWELLSGFSCFSQIYTENRGTIWRLFAGLGKIAKKGIEIEFFFVYNDTVVVLTHCAYCEWGTAP